MSVNTRSRSSRVAVSIVGVIASASLIGACSSTSSTSSPASTPATTTAAASSTPGDTTVLPPSTSARPPVVPVTPTVAPPVIQSPVSPVSPPTTSPATGYPPSGTTFSGENMTAGQITDLQQAVDNGHQPWRLDRVSVAKSFLQGRFGWTDVQTEFGPPTVLFVTNKDGGKLSVHLVQPATQGDNGIWEVSSGTWN